MTLRSLRGDAVCPSTERPGGLDFLDLGVAEAEKVPQNFLRVLAEQRRALDLARAVAELDRIADRNVLSARRVIDLDQRPRGEERFVLGELLHGQDRAARDVVLVQD